MEENNNGHRLTLLFDRNTVMAHSVVRRGDGIYISTDAGLLPVYAFKMEKGLMNLLKDYMEVWYE